MLTKLLYVPLKVMVLRQKEQGGTKHDEKQGCSLTAAGRQ